MASLTTLVHELDLLISAVNGIYIANFFAVALFAAMIYDTLLTLSKEIEFIWCKPFTYPKGLYLISRYYGLASLGGIAFMSIIPNRSISSCRSFIAWYTVGALQVSETVINLILFLRIYALYSQKKKLLYLILPCYLFETGCTFYAGFKAGKKFTSAMMALPFKLPLANCQLYVRVLPSFEVTLVAWIPSFVLAALFFALSAYKVYEKAVVYGSARSSRTLVQSLALPQLMKTIVRDGVVYYLVFTLTTLLNATLVLREIQSSISGIALSLYLLTESLCGCHLLLNLYEVGKQQRLTTQITGVDMAFQSPRNVFMTQTDLPNDILDTPTLEA